MLPRGWDRRTIVLLTFALLALIGTNHAHSQVFDFEKDRVQIAELHGFWRFHTGDDPDGKLGWAQPGFDDSSWQLGHSDQPLDVQGCPAYSGVAWYRFKVLLPLNHPPFALFVPEIGTSFQVFAGGRLIGQYGALPPHERVYLGHPVGSTSHTHAVGQIEPIPDTADGRVSLVIAIRVWQWPDFAFFCDPLFDPLSIGDASLISDLRQHRWNYEFRSLSAENALLFSYLLAALAGLGLFLLRRSEVEYLWFAAVGLVLAARCFWEIFPAFHPLWLQGYNGLYGLLLFLQAICLSMFYVTLLKERRGWPFWGSIGSASFGLLMFVPIVTGWMSFTTWFSVINLAWVPFIMFQFLLLFLPARRGNLDARLLLVPFSLQYGATLGGAFLFGMRAFGLGGTFIAFWAEKWDGLFRYPFPVSIPNIVEFVTQISFLAILVLRFARSRRDEERFKAELEAARTVQQVLIPEEIPAIPGLALECVYKPAGQVGGDFFQILRTSNNGALIVIGDVSGKGMPAAMAVSLLVGTVRTLAHYTQSPAEILTAMNQRMLGRSRDGFTTCLVLRLDPDGAATVANAGHLAPYLGNTEVPVESGLPLGLAAQAEYTESSFHLDTGGEITLVTDGVAEARAKTGELFGFERTASITILSAAQIAATAQAFGQQDDITVLKIRRQPISEPALASPSALPPAFTAQKQILSHEA
jgi:hypothetical protein